MATATENLGNIIRSYRKLKNYSTQELAQSLDVSTGFLNNLEHGRNDVFKLDLLMRIIERLDIPLHKLLESDHIEIKGVNLKPSHAKLELILSNDTNSSEKLEESIRAILSTYLDALKAFDYDDNSIETISSHIINLLTLIKNIKIT